MRFSFRFTMFYLKYRPRKFSEVIGLTSITHTIQKALSQKSLPHAYLFTGPRGSGKTTTARLLAKALNCENPVQTEDGIEVCDQCQNCRSISEGHFLDLIEIDAASNRGIDDIRSLREKVRLSPTSGKFKVYIIDEVHMLTIEAFNALLKTLEEPPAHAIFILATTEPQKIPETIKSRCHVFNFKRADRESLLSKMERILESEGASLERGKMEEIVRLSEGGFRDAETLLEQFMAGFDDTGRRTLTPAFLVDLLAQRQSKGALDFVGKLHNEGVSLSVFTQDLLFFLRDLLLVKSGVSQDNLSLDEASFKAIGSLSKFFTNEEVYMMISAFIKASQDFKVVPVPQLPLEMAIVRVLDQLESSKDVASEGGRDLPDLPSSGRGLPSGGQGGGVKPEPKKEKGEAAPSVEESEERSAPSVSLEVVESRWADVLKEVKPENHSLEALLRSAHPKEVSGQIVRLEVYYKFHKDKLSARQNLDILESVFSRVFGTPLKIHCALGQIIKSDAGVEGGVVAAVSDEDIKTAALKASTD